MLGPTRRALCNYLFAEPIFPLESRHCDPIRPRGRRIRRDSLCRDVCATLALEEYRIDEVYALDVNVNRRFRLEILRLPGLVERGSPGRL
jgi:hypothetical protein